MALVKCKWCEEKVEKESAFVIEKQTKEKLKSGKQKVLRTYLHDKCVDAYFDDKAFKEREQKQLDSLRDTIMEIHGIRPEDFPRHFYQLLQDIRNGNMIGRQRKNYKSGTEYRIIEKAYLLAESDIKWQKLKKSFDTTLGELKYGLAIVRDKLKMARDRDRAEKQARKIAKAGLQKEIAPDANNFKKKDKEDLDITDFLD
ncbi:hypothetical protein [Exiguobacterium sp. s133]|uniref:hypothetical protein n=1 Tax=Exiguobacterium sp. s133 TaxID=2751213 RepID=UPI001BE6E7F8|nr:hypothetical protein [Exiguobacterium sp. s133]